MLEQRTPFHNESIFLTCDDPFKKSESSSRSQAQIAPKQNVYGMQFSDSGSHQRSMMLSDGPVLEPVTVAGENGSELTIDANNRVNRFKDAAGRQFVFGYDACCGTLNKLTIETGNWTRTRSVDGRYLNDWMNDLTTQTWSGHVTIGKNGFSMSNSVERILYSPCGTKTLENLANGEVVARTKEDAQGNTSIEDTRSQKIQYRFVDGRSAVRNVLDNSLLGYDAQGRLTVMHDAGGRKFEFQKYDADGNPHYVVNERGIWDEISNHVWCNPETGRFWYGSVAVNNSGAYTFTELSGKATTRYCNGYAVEDYGGIRTITDADGHRTRQYADGQEFKEPPLMGNARFNVRNGVTTDCKLYLERGNCSTFQNSDGMHAVIQLNGHSPVGVFQDGVVIYSSRQPDANDQRTQQVVIGLSENDLEVLNRLSQGTYVVIVQCYDKVARGIRYEIYSGFEQANVVTGDKVKAGQPIGRLGADGTLKFAVRRNSVGGASVQISTDV